MAGTGGASDTDTSRAELFDSLGHPLRIKILQALEAGSLGFGDLKRKVGVESNGNLQYHLGRLDGLVRASADGSYAITDDGREALRIVRTGSLPQAGKETSAGGKVVISRAVLALLVASLLLVSMAAIYGQFELRTLQQQIGTSQSTNTTTTTTTTTATACVILGQPGPIFLRVLSDSTLNPLVGAQIMAKNQPALCNGSPATGQTTLTFTTNGTEWYSLGSENDAGYSFIISYSGQNYTFTANLAPVSVTCATLFVPSGRTNVTITEFQSTCG